MSLEIRVSRLEQYLAERDELLRSIEATVTLNLNDQMELINKQDILDKHRDTVEPYG